MASRKKKFVVPPQLLAFAVILGGGWLILASAAQNPGGVETLLFSLALIGAAFFLFRQWPKRQLNKKLSETVSSHAETLVRRRAQVLHRDAYGNLQSARWNREIEAFIDGTVGPKLTSRERNVLNKGRMEFIQTVSDAVAEAATAYPAFTEFNPNMTPTQFEVFCAEELRRQGWDADVTKGSRDQGVDVIAKKNGNRIVLQCKLYNQPVGNKAVQEVVAARAHESAHFGAVVTNNQYTVPARELAGTNNVWLLHYSDLARIDTLLKEYPARRT